MPDRDYIQRPVDEGYQRGIESMGRTGPRVSAAEWFEAIARMFAAGLAMRGGVGSPRVPVSRLPRGKMSPKEPDPEIVRQLERAKFEPSAPSYEGMGYTVGSLGDSRLGVRPSGSMATLPGVALKSEAWGPKGLGPDVSEFQAILAKLAEIGLWP